MPKKKTVQRTENSEQKHYKWTKLIVLVFGLIFFMSGLGMLPSQWFNVESILGMMMVSWLISTEID